MANENETVDVFHELNELHDLIWEYGELRISEYEGSECAADENRRDINEKFEIVKREIATKDAEIDILRVRNIETQNAVDGRNKELARRAALIGELVELLNKLIPNECYRVCGKDPCDHIAVLEDIKTNGGEPCPCVLLSALIAKAKEVVSNG